jgi:hypothetical protein
MELVADRNARCQRTGPIWQLRDAQAVTAPPYTRTQASPSFFIPAARFNALRSAAPL